MHILGAALEYSAGLCSRSSTRVRSPSPAPAPVDSALCSSQLTALLQQQQSMLCPCNAHGGSHIKLTRTDMHDSMQGQL